jgi:hypothetical protein
MKYITLFAVLVYFGVSSAAQAQAVDESIHSMDMLSPAYYKPAEDNPFRAEVDAFITASRKVVFHHPFENADREKPDYQIPDWGKFGAGKPPWKSVQYHPAWDFKVGGGETEVQVYAAHDGQVTTFRDAPKYRHYLAITKPVTDEQGKVPGEIGDRVCSHRTQRSGRAASGRETCSKGRAVVQPPVFRNYGWTTPAFRSPLLPRQG